MTVMDHPAVVRSLQTGYPQMQGEQPTCVGCGCELGDDVFVWDGDYLCEDCCRDAVEATFSFADIAEALQISIKKSWEVSF